MEQQKTRREAKKPGVLDPQINLRFTRKTTAYKPPKRDITRATVCVNSLSQAQKTQPISGGVCVWGGGLLLVSVVMLWLLHLCCGLYIWFNPFGPLQKRVPNWVFNLIDSLKGTKRGTWDSYAAFVSHLSVRKDNFLTVHVYIHITHYQKFNGGK